MACVLRSETSNPHVKNMSKICQAENYIHMSLKTVLTQKWTNKTDNFFNQQI